jgi:glycosyltransferase involved in cell wall biosynthesis
MAIVHDWLTGMRGGERVLEALCERFPHADLFTLVHVRGSVTPAIERHRPRQSLVGYLPLARRYYRHCLPLFPAAVEQFDLDGYDLIVSSSHCAVKAVVPTGRARHVCYCHSPMRYAWDQFDAYFGTERLGGLSRVARAVMNRVARWDAATAGRVHRYIANSRHVAQRIGRYYNRRSVIVYPPVDTDFFRPSGAPPEPVALVVSALVPYKRVELAIEAARLAGLPLTIAGDGPERGRLEAMAGPDVTFIGSPSDAGVRDLYNRAQVVVLPGEEDFGLVPVEAQACGRPVVALARGGALETVVDGVTGLLVAEATPQAFAGALRRVQGMAFDRDAIRAHAERFSKAAFIAGIGRELDAVLEAPVEAVRW